MVSRTVFSVNKIRLGTCIFVSLNDKTAQKTADISKNPYCAWLSDLQNLDFTLS